MKYIAIALGFAIVLPALPARAAPAAAFEQTYRDLETASGLDLSREWAAYAEHDRSEPFPQYVDRRFRVRRDIGRGFVFGGLSLGIVSAAFFSFAFTVPDPVHRVPNYAIAGTTIALGTGLIIAGAILWGRNAKRLARLDDAVEKLELGPEFSSARKRLQVRAGGLGLHLAF